jgi:uncharacterized repeat protein (TIGR03987 family)
MTIASVLIVLAFVFYTFAIFKEKKSRPLNEALLLIFLLAVLCDISGTLMMFSKAKPELTIHAALGFSALAIMFIHFMWAMFSFLGSESAKKLFHKHSLKAWIIWMMAFVSGLLF